VPPQRPAARVVAQLLDRAQYRINLGPGGPSGPELRKPVTRCFEVSEGFVGVAERARHSAARSTAGVGNRKRVVSAKAIDPSSHLGGINQSTGSHIGPSLRDALGFPRDPGLPLSLGLGMGRLTNASVRDASVRDGHNTDDNSCGRWRPGSRYFRP
jgi:hypothetical protein